MDKRTSCFIRFKDFQSFFSAYAMDEEEVLESLQKSSLLQIQFLHVLGLLGAC